MVLMEAINNMNQEIRAKREAKAEAQKIAVDAKEQAKKEIVQHEENKKQGMI